MQRKHALPIAERIVDAFRPHCHRIEVVGSVRRRKPDVHDIEILVVPKWKTEEVETGLISEVRPVNQLLKACKTWNLRFSKTGTRQYVPWDADEAGKYWKVFFPDWKGNQELSFYLDIFLVTEASFGNQKLVRTGPAAFSEAVVTFAKRWGKPFKDGRVLMQGKPVDLREEQDVFKLLGLQYIEPEDRMGPESIRPVSFRSYRGGSKYG